MVLIGEIKVKIGVISDTHDNRDCILKAIEIFNTEKVDLVLHCGDHIAPFTLEWYKGLNAKMIGVKGNLDAEYQLLKEKYESLGWEFHRFSAVITLERKKIILLHGVDENVIKGLIHSDEYDIIVRGHLHKIINEWHKDTLHFSPGEACGYLTQKRTIGIIKLPEISAEIIEI